jgi:pimeloyl-ACP methyl ester carboxylesterase
VRPGAESGSLPTEGRRVVALDLSGHGDSGRREAYTLDQWSREVLAAAGHAGITKPPTVIGHSMGGFVALRAAGLYGSRLARVVAIGRLAPVIEIPAAGHHVMLDQPLALVTGLRTLLSDWDQSLSIASRSARISSGVTDGS